MQFEFNTSLSRLFANTRSFGKYLMQKHEAAEIVPEGQAEAVEKLKISLNKQIEKRAKDKIDEPNMTAALKAMVDCLTDDQTVAIWELSGDSNNDLLDEFKKQIIKLNQPTQESEAVVQKELKLPLNFLKFLNLANGLLPLVSGMGEHSNHKMMALIPNFEAGLEHNFSVVRAYRQQCPVAILHAKDAYYGYKDSTSKTDKALYALRFFFAAILELPFLGVKNLVLDSIALVGNLAGDILSLPELVFESIRVSMKPSITSKSEENDEPVTVPAQTLSPEQSRAQKPAVTPGFTQSQANPIAPPASTTEEVAPQQRKVSGL